MTSLTRVLVCDRCNTVAAGVQLLIAKPGGNHYIDHAGFRGRNSEFFRRATKCGRWVERKPEPPP